MCVYVIVCVYMCVYVCVFCWCSGERARVFACVVLHLFMSQANESCHTSEYFMPHIMSHK